MSKKMNPVAKLLAIYETLTEEQSAIAFDLLRSKQPKPGKPSAGAKKRGVRSAGTQSSRRATRKGLPQSTEGPRESASNASRDGDNGSEDVS